MGMTWPGLALEQFYSPHTSKRLGVDLALRLTAGSVFEAASRGPVLPPRAQQASKPCLKEKKGTGAEKH